MSAYDAPCCEAMAQVPLPRAPAAPSHCHTRTCSSASAVWKAEAMPEGYRERGGGREGGREGGGGRGGPEGGREGEGGGGGGEREREREIQTHAHAHTHIYLRHFVAGEDNVEHQHTATC